MRLQMLRSCTCELNTVLGRHWTQCFPGLGSYFANKNVTIFHFTHLSQSWWPDGQYTAPTDEALASDIQAVPMFGLNMIRCEDSGRGWRGEGRGWRVEERKRRSCR